MTVRAHCVVRAAAALAAFALALTGALLLLFSVVTMVLFPTMRKLA